MTWVLYLYWFAPIILTPLSFLLSLWQLGCAIRRPNPPLASVWLTLVLVTGSFAFMQLRNFVSHFRPAAHTRPSTSREGFGGEHAGIEWKSRAGSGEAQQ
jgi:hypothetical protein